MSRSRRRSSWCGRVTSMRLTFFLSPQRSWFLSPPNSCAAASSRLSIKFCQVLATIDDTASDNDAMRRKIFIGANLLNKGKRWQEVKAKKFRLCELQWFAMVQKFVWGILFHLGQRHSH
jgi:hypothetical protein